MFVSDELNRAERYFGEFGGCFMPELLMPALQQLSDAFHDYANDPAFLAHYKTLLKDYVGRETPLTEVKRFRQHCAGPRLFLKREDLLHTGAHKINNSLGQCLLAKKMGKRRVIAETGAGQHGVATATICALLGLECVVYMGAKDVARQQPNVEKMKRLGAQVIAVNLGQKTLKEAVNEALRDYAHHFESSHYCLGSALGPAPYPQMVALFQSVIGEEVQRQCQQKIGTPPDIIIACVGGGSNAIGIFSPFIADPSIRLIGVEAGGHGNQLGQHAARFRQAKRGVLHGCYSYVLQDPRGQIATTSSISAGLDYPMVGPQHAALYQEKRVEYVAVSDTMALNAFNDLTRLEGIIPALESSHALAYYQQIAHQCDPEAIVVVNLSGRGDKDLPQLMSGEK